VWEYRILCDRDGWHIVEYYHKDGKGNDGYCKASLADWFSKSELEATFGMMKAAFSKPTLTVDNKGDIVEYLECTQKPPGGGTNTWGK